MFSGTKNIPHNTTHIKTKCREYPRIWHGILSVPQNIVMNLKNVMKAMYHQQTTKKITNKKPRQDWVVSEIEEES